MPNEMSPSEIREFISEQGHGVLILTSDEPYGIPISFGINNGTIITQLLSTEDSRKQRLLDENINVSLVVYEVNGPFDWRSVIIEGKLRRFDDPPTKQELKVFTTDAKSVDLSVFNKEDDSELEGNWYTFEIDTISAYQTPLEE